MNAYLSVIDFMFHLSVYLGIGLFVLWFLIKMILEVLIAYSKAKKIIKMIFLEN